MLKNLLIIFFSLVISLTASIENEFLTRVKQKIEQIKPFSVKFKNQVVNNESIELEESGEFFFKNSNELKWIYTEPDYKVWLIKNNRYKFYDKEDEQLTTGILNDKDRLWIWQLINNDKFKKYLKINVRDKTIHIIKESEAINTKIFINNNYLPEKVVQKDQTGVDIIYIFYNYKNNTKFSKEDFELKIDDNTDIIELK
ncbi:MAG: outer-membrane lipoprotein carrier protein LolA [Acidobacteriota bacterium]